MANHLMRSDPLGGVARFEPFRNLEDFFSDIRMMPALRGMEADSRIRMDVMETEQTYTVRAEVPGVKKEDIKVAIDGNQVTISAQLHKEEQSKSGNVVRTERYYGNQSRSFTLAHEVDDTKAKARYQDGILELTLPKRPGTGGKQLSIQ